MSLSFQFHSIRPDGRMRQADVKQMENQKVYGTSVINTGGEPYEKSDRKMKEAVKETSESREWRKTLLELKKIMLSDTAYTISEAIGTLESTLKGEI